LEERCRMLLRVAGEAARLVFLAERGKVSPGGGEGGGKRQGAGRAGRRQGAEERRQGGGGSSALLLQQPTHAARLRM
jgi:hypothetical protein